MSRDDWYRSPNWKNADKELFFQKMSRAKSNDTRSQYARIKAHYMIGTGKKANCRSAIELLNTASVEWPSRFDFDNDMIHYTLGDAYKKLGDYKKAADCFEKTINFEKESGNPGCWDYPEMVITNKMFDLYDRALEIVNHQQYDRIIWPFYYFVYHAVRACVYAKMGDVNLSKSEANIAMEFVKVTKFLPRHKGVGLVTNRRYGKLIKMVKKLV